MTTTQAVPTKRADRSGDVVLRFNPTDAGTPPALKSWFYPGTSYGHEFIYPDEQAREIAQRTKSIVLSTDVPGGDDELIGRRVALEGVQVSDTADTRGFFLSGTGERIFVLPAADTDANAGKTVSIEGVVLEMPRGLEDRLKAGGTVNDEINVYATSVS